MKSVYNQWRRCAMKNSSPAGSMKSAACHFERRGSLAISNGERNLLKAAAVSFRAKKQPCHFERRDGRVISSKAAALSFRAKRQPCHFEQRSSLVISNGERNLLKAAAVSFRAKKQPCHFERREKSVDPADIEQQISHGALRLRSVQACPEYSRGIRDDGLAINRTDNSYKNLHSA
jgi:hypothetical protein